MKHFRAHGGDDDSDCLLFEDGFESGDTSAWSSPGISISPL